MKLWLIITSSLVVLTGCASRTENIQLQNTNARQALLIQQQQAQIDALKTKIEVFTKERAKAKAKARARARAKTKLKQSQLPQIPKKNIKLKKVEDNNYSSGYMYPETKKKKSIKVAQSNTINSSMNKAECIKMIGVDKFEKYTKMFGSEDASIKRCSMLKAMRQ